MATSIIIDSTDSAMKKRQKAITNISETATDNQLLAFAKAINALSTNTLNRVSRVEKRELESVEYQIVGADSLAAEYYRASPSASEMCCNYFVTDSNGDLVKNITFSWVLDIDSSKAEVENLSENTHWAQIRFYPKVNENFVGEITLAATFGDNVNLTKKIKLYGFAEVSY